MTYQEAEKIFKEYQIYMEIHSKLYSLFLSIPESFLPYPIDTINEALDIIADGFDNNGDNNAVKIIRETQSFLYAYEDDNTALINMTRKLNMLSESEKLKEMVIKKLKENKDNWLKHKKR